MNRFKQKMIRFILESIHNEGESIHIKLGNTMFLLKDI